MKQGSKIGIVCCSNGLRPEQAETIKMLVQILEKSGLEVDLSPYLYGDENGQAGTARERAGALMKFYEDDSVTDIFDVSGGDMANEILSYLDFQTIAYGKKHFWGYSDLTTIINAIYARTGKSSVLYQIRNLTYDHSQSQITDFLNTTLAGSSSLYDFPYEFVQGDSYGGNCSRRKYTVPFEAGWHALLAGYAGENPASGVLWRKTAADGDLFKPVEPDGGI